MELMELFRDESVRAILKKLLWIEIDAYRQVANHKAVDPEEELFLLQFQSSTKEVKSMANNRASVLENMLNQGILSNILILPEIEVMMLRHILFRMEDQWVNDNPEGIRKTWELFFQIEESKQPQLQYINKYIKFTRNGNRN